MTKNSVIPYCGTEIKITVLKMKAFLLKDCKHLYTPAPMPSEWLWLSGMKGFQCQKHPA